MSGVVGGWQVADELVAEFKKDESMPFDEKNIRRRIYDALNVLMAMDIITKDKKHIKWKGFPQSWEKERQGLQRRVDDAARQVLLPLPPPPPSFSRALPHPPPWLRPSAPGDEEGRRGGEARGWARPTGSGSGR